MQSLFFLTFFLVFFLSCNQGGSTKNGGTNTSSSSTDTQDPLAGQAWHLKNTGQDSYSTLGGTPGEDLKIAEAVALGVKGNNVRIAVSDTGVDLGHPDLAGNALTGEHRDYSTDTPSNWAPGGSPAPIENEGHGTAVTGLIAALAGNHIGSRGVAPLSKYAGFLFIGNFHSSDASYEAKYLDQMLGSFDIFNYSYGYPGCNFYPATTSVIDAFEYGVKNLRAGKGAVYVKAAGNDYIGANSDCHTNDSSHFLGNTNTSEDMNIPYIINAAAVNAKGIISSYSTPGSGVWVSSAGGEFGTNSPAMISTDIQGCALGLSNSSTTQNAFNKGALTINNHCDYTSIMNGTSSATPTLAGVIALLLEANPYLTWRDVKHILAITATKVNYSTGALAHPGGATLELAGHTYDYVYVQNAAGIDYSNTYGFGRVNAKDAVQMAKVYSSGLGTYVETKNPNSSAWYYASGAVNIPIPDASAAGASSSLNVRHNLKVEAVQIKLSTNHTYLGDLGVELVSPQGTRSKLLLINSNINQAGLTDYTLLTNAFYNETSLGAWTLQVIDGGTGDTGLLQSWKIKINGHNVSGTGDTVNPNAPSGLTLPATYVSTTSSPTVTFTNSNSADVVRYEVAVSSNPNGTELAKWYSIGLTNSFQVTGLTLTTGQTYYVRVRAVDSSENSSSAVSASWVAL